jgi:hypothetical protein
VCVQALIALLARAHGGRRLPLSPMQRLARDSTRERVDVLLDVGPTVPVLVLLAVGSIARV